MWQVKFESTQNINIPIEQHREPGVAYNDIFLYKQEPKYAVPSLQSFASLHEALDYLIKVNTEHEEKGFRAILEPV